MACTHNYRARPEGCRHAVAGTSGRCLWHNPSVRKDDAYVADLLVQADALSGGDFEEAHLAGLVCTGADLAKRCFRGADLRDTRLDGTSLAGADCTDAVLRRASLRRCDLRGARFNGADLTGASLAGADLRDADLQGAILDGTALNGADLRGANLAGAKIISFRWNRYTRFAGIRGFEPREDADGEQPTQAFLSPLALGAADLDSGARSALAEPDPDLERTRVYLEAVEPPPPPPLSATATTMALVLPNAAETATATTMPLAALTTGSLQGLSRSTPRRASRWALPTALAAAVAGLAVGALGWLHALRAPLPVPPAGDVAAITAERDALQRQVEADVSELRRQQERANLLADGAGQARQEAAQRRGEAEAARAQLREAERELARLRDAEDRATVLAVRLEEREALSRDLTVASSRGERMAKVLADGVDRLRVENQRLAKEAASASADRARRAELEAEQARLARELSATTIERDRLNALYQSSTASLAQAEDALARYLARLRANRLDELVGDAAERAPLHPIAAGSPLALGGDYLVTLRVDPGREAGMVSAGLTVQRPAAAANPDVTVVLYDAARRPLRRLSFGFPHVDNGKPFVATATQVACDRFPAFARVLVAPGVEDVATTAAPAPAGRAPH